MHLHTSYGGIFLYVDTFVTCKKYTHMHMSTFFTHVANRILLINKGQYLLEARRPVISKLRNPLQSKQFLFFLTRMQLFFRVTFIVQ